MRAVSAIESIQIEAQFDPATSTLTYVVFDPESRDAVIIDPVLDYEPLASTTATRSVEKVASFVDAQRLRVHCVLETHAHADHLSGSQWLKRRYVVPVAIGERIVAVQSVFKRLFALPPSFRTDGAQFDRLLADGAELELGTLRIGVIPTPGHTPACVSYRIADAVFTGDALFIEDQGTARTDFPEGSAGALYDSVQRLYALPDETRVFPCHDYQPNGRALRWVTTIARSKEANVQLRAATTRAEYLALRAQRDAGLAPPRLYYPSVQVNVDAGRLPPPHANGRRYLITPLNLASPTEDDGTPRPR